MDIEDIYNIITNFLPMNDLLSYSLTNKDNLKKCMNHKRLNKILKHYDFINLSNLKIISMIGSGFNNFLNNINDIWNSSETLLIYFYNNGKKMGQILHQCIMNIYRGKIKIIHKFIFSKKTDTCFMDDDNVEEIENEEFINFLDYIYFDFLLKYQRSRIMLSDEIWTSSFKYIHEYKILPNK